jgi:hypothetical protein
MGTGRYDHPAYLVPQWQHFGKTTAGAAGTSIRHTPPYAIRIKSVTAGVVTAGTVAGAAAGIVIQQDGTAKGTISLSTNVAGVFGTAGGLDFTVPAGGTLAFVNGTDATFVADVSMEYKIDPAASWTGNT